MSLITIIVKGKFKYYLR